jgi:hypothetical protein
LGPVGNGQTGWPYARAEIVCYLKVRLLTSFSLFSFLPITDYSKLRSTSFHLSLCSSCWCWELGCGLIGRKSGGLLGRGRGLEEGFSRGCVSIISLPFFPVSSCFAFEFESDPCSSRKQRTDLPCSTAAYLFSITISISPKVPLLLPLPTSMPSLPPLNPPSPPNLHDLPAFLLCRPIPVCILPPFPLPSLHQHPDRSSFILP